MTKIHKSVVALMLSIGSVGLADGAVSADPPTVFEDSVTFPDVNPCTGDDMEVTIDSVVSLHLHGERVVVHASRTGSTDNGDVMERGVDSFVSNGRVVRRAFTDNWIGPDGSRWQVQGGFVDNLNTGETTVDRFRLRCINS